MAGPQHTVIPLPLPALFTAPAWLIHPQDSKHCCGHTFNRIIWLLDTQMLFLENTDFKVVSLTFVQPCLTPGSHTPVHDLYGYGSEFSVHRTWMELVSGDRDGWKALQIHSTLSGWGGSNPQVLAMPIFCTSWANEQSQLFSRRAKRESWSVFLEQTFKAILLLLFVFVLRT